jgi:phosphopantothenoylcysteine decarboxylase / phosphopantothenate---cysteine ligase
LVSGPTALEPPSGARLIEVNTAAEMREAVLKEYPHSSAVIMAAAVADYHAVAPSGQKIKRGVGDLELRLMPNPDILKELGQNKDDKWLVGFAAETENLTTNAQKKLREKNLDIVIANNVAEEGSGFDGDTNAGTIIDRTGAVRSLPLMSKDDLADSIYDHYLSLKNRS